MRYLVQHTTRYLYYELVPVCHNEVRLAPRSFGRQNRASFELRVEPSPAVIGCRQDYFGNQVNFFSLHEGHRELVVAGSSTVDLEPAATLEPEGTMPWEQVRDSLQSDRSPIALDAFQFAFNSPRVHASRDLAEYAAHSFTPNRPWLAAALELTQRIHSDFAYDQTATSVTTSLDEAFRLRRGVCQDFAHIQIGCLRSLGLPARYVSGYLLTTPPPGKLRQIGCDASHAWLSMYAPDLGWVDFDPTNNVIPSMQHITVAWGRDYDDICPIRGVFVGGGNHTMTVAVDLRPLMHNGPATEAS
ncbi:MAG: transglutaminase family protein [Planctomycetes bacterium]|nr:transglutaminase family protein [Planctomycetota bacterium]